MSEGSEKSIAAPESVRVANPEDVDAAILKAVRGIRFGSVEVMIHDSNVVQIDCKEKIRLGPPTANMRDKRGS